MFIMSQDAKIVNPAFNFFLQLKNQLTEQIVPLFEIQSTSSEE